MVLIFRLFLALVVAGVLTAIATIGKSLFCSLNDIHASIVLKHFTTSNDEELYREASLNKTIHVPFNPEEHQRNLEAADQWQMGYDPHDATFDAPKMG